MNDTWALRIVKACLGGALAFWVSVPAAVQLLVILIGFDLLSCLMTHRSGIQHTLKRGTLTLLLCGATHITWVMAKDITGFNLNFDIGSAVVVYYIFGELIEIFLNCGTVIGIPPKFIQWLETAQSMTGQQKTINAQRREIDTLKRNASDAGRV